MAKTKINKNQLANVFVESVNEQLPDASGDVLITNVATADNLTSPDNINDYGTFIFRTSAGTKSIASDKDSVDPTYLSEATLMSIQGEIKNPRRDANNIVDNYIQSSTPRFTVAIDAATFGALSFVNHREGTHVYTFTYNGTQWDCTYVDDNTQTITVENVDLATAGITVTPAKTEIVTVENDYITVDYTYETSEPDPETGTESVSEYASATYTTETKLVFASTVEETFAQKVNEVVGDYTFNYNGNAWMLGDTLIDLSEYGISYTGVAIEGDIFEVTYNGAMEVATPTSFITSSFNQFNPANVLSGYKIEYNENNNSWNIVPATGYSVAFIKGVGGLNNAYGSRFGDYTIYDDNTTGTIDTVAFRKEAPTVGYTFYPTENSTVVVDSNGVATGFDTNNYLRITNVNKFKHNISFEIKVVFETSNASLNYIIFGAFAVLLQISYGRLEAAARNTNGVLQNCYGTTSLANNTKYYSKIIYTTNKLQLYLSTDDVNYNLEKEIDFELVDSTNDIIKYGYSDTQKLYMKENYIRFNNELWFNGRAADTPQPVITSGNEGVVVVNKSTLQDPPQDMLEPNKIQYITFPVDGYICVSMTNTSKLCVHPEWSGYMDKVYQDYIAPVTWENNPLVTVNGIEGSTPKRRKPSIINIPTQGIDTDKLTQNPIAFEPISCKDYLARVGLVYDEIRFEDHRYIKRIEKEQYSAERVAELEGEGKQLVYDSQYIYWVLPQPKIYVINCTIENNAPVLDTNQSGQYMVCDFGTEEFTNTEVAVLGNFLYGNNLVDKLRTDVLTKSAQSLSQDQKEQVWDNLGLQPIYNHVNTLQPNATVTINLVPTKQVYELTPTSNTTLEFNTANLTEFNAQDSDVEIEFTLYIKMVNAQQAWEITFPDTVVWGNTSPTMTAMANYKFSFCKPKGSSVFIGNQMYSWVE